MSCDNAILVTFRKTREGKEKNLLGRVRKASESSKYSSKGGNMCERFIRLRKGSFQQAVPDRQKACSKSFCFKC